MVQFDYETAAARAAASWFRISPVYYEALLCGCPLFYRYFFAGLHKELFASEVRGGGTYIGEQQIKGKPSKAAGGLDAAKMAASPHARHSLSQGSVAQSGCDLFRSLYSSTFVDFDRRKPRNDFRWKRQVCAMARRRR
jgi:hypothetical protein